MGYIALVDPAVGDVTKAAWAAKVGSNLEDHEARLQSAIEHQVNGSMEVVDDSGEPPGWTISDLGPGGSEGDHSVVQGAGSGVSSPSASSREGWVKHGSNSLKCDLNSSGGYVEFVSTDYIPVNSDRMAEAAMTLLPTDASVKVQIEALWYDEDYQTNGTTTLLDETTGWVTSQWADFALQTRPPAGSVWAKIRITAGSTASSSPVDASVYFDQIRFGDLKGLATRMDNTAIGVTYTGPATNYWDVMAEAGLDGIRPSAFLCNVGGGDVTFTNIFTWLDGDYVALGGVGATQNVPMILRPHPVTGLIKNVTTGTASKSFSATIVVVGFIF